MATQTDRTDPTVEKLVEFAHSLSISDLTPEAIWEAKRRLIDCFAIALAGYTEDPSIISRKLALATSGTPGATVIGTVHLSSPENAVLANGTMIHSQDYMDTYLSRESLHPSDTISAILAAGECAGASGNDILLGIVLSYEVMCKLADCANVRERGWDHVVFGAIASALASAKVLKLTPDQMRETLGLAVVSNTALRQTRVGEVPMWKAFAPANAARNGLLAARLAQMGVNGPFMPFRGAKGFENQVSGPLNIGEFGSRANGYRINQTYIKLWPVQYNTQAGIRAALDLRKLVPDLSDISRIQIDISEIGRILSADTQAKWDPQTRETADHSLPYIVVSALMDGDVSRATFDRENYRDPKKLEMVRNVEVRADPEFTKSYPEKLTVRVTLLSKSGAKFEKMFDYPKGHFRDPLSDAEVAGKFQKFAQVHMQAGAIKSALDATWGFERVGSIGEFMRLFSFEQKAK